MGEEEEEEEEDEEESEDGSSSYTSSVAGAKESVRTGLISRTELLNWQS